MADNATLTTGAVLSNTVEAMSVDNQAHENAGAPATLTAKSTLGTYALPNVNGPGKDDATDLVDTMPEVPILDLRSATGLV